MDDAVSAGMARADLTHLIERAEAGESTVITRRGVPVAAIVPVGDYEVLGDVLGTVPGEGEPGRVRGS
ncbi:type II toxin-antitoxin system Phd/YefM family antitoxin [Streptomyces acidiscabies]|uniref:type II toxin-antitoxin system Phd/YefM family antitoxin n=1 Tax=Streptomyces acidiscabies TaxID=42234 RepID=UPI00067B799D|nr:type II toxin-antitoxin system prevent-host-death family antitoxin [Streptomyces acidiscabies]